MLLDNGRTDVLADEVGRQALRCIRCSACLNVCPVYSRTGGHAYESVYPGPIGAILTPQLEGLEKGRSLPYASSLCGACYEVCPVEIDIPRVLVHLRGRVVDTEPAWSPGKGGDEGAVPGVLLAPRLRARAAGGAARLAAARAPRAHRAPAVAAVRLDRHARPARAAEGDLPGLVEARARRRRRRALRRLRARRNGSPRRRRLPRRPATPGRSSSAASVRRWRTARPRSRCRATTGAAAERSRAEVVDLFAERVGEYRAERPPRRARRAVRRAARLCREHGARRLAVPADLPRGLPRGRRGARARRRALARRSSTASTARSPAARSRSPRPA